MAKKTESQNQFPFPYRAMPPRDPRPDPKVERRKVQRPASPEEILAKLSLDAPLDAMRLSRRRVDQLSTTPYTVEAQLPGAVLLRWGRDLEVWRKVDVPRKGYAIAFGADELEFVAKHSSDRHPYEQELREA